LLEDEALNFVIIDDGQPDPNVIDYENFDDSNTYPYDANRLNRTTF